MSDNNYKNRIKKLREFSEKNKLCFCIAMALAYLFSVCHIISKNKILKNCIITIATLIVVGVIGCAVVYSGLLEQLTGNKVKDQMFADYEDRAKWQSMMLVNIAKAGFFSSDRTIEEYDRDIWHLRESVKNS